MIAIVDYGVGNLYSIKCSLARVGAECVVTRSEKDIESAERIILPGVGAFGDAAQKLRGLGLDALLKRQAALGKPLLGICLGMQLLFERSFEYGEHEGLGLLPGDILPFTSEICGARKIPHMGWNSLSLLRPGDPLARGIREGEYMYYVHSYYAETDESVLVGVSEYGARVPGLVRRGNVCGAQFHPEKSGDRGLTILRAFATEDLTC